jgi:hypothetical protein
MCERTISKKDRSTVVLGKDRVPVLEIRKIVGSMYAGKKVHTLS